MSIIIKLIRYLFLVKEIISKQGVVHFRRYRLIQTPWFALYVHQICQSDMDKDPHSHPWDFESLILRGAYREKMYSDTGNEVINAYYSGDVVKHTAGEFHQIKLLSRSVWSLVYTSGGPKNWGYKLKDGRYYSHQEYRQLKNEGKL